MQEGRKRFGPTVHPLVPRGRAHPGAEWVSENGVVLIRKTGALTQSLRISPPNSQRFKEKVNSPSSAPARCKKNTVPTHWGIQQGSGWNCASSRRPRFVFLFRPRREKVRTRLDSRTGEQRTNLGFASRTLLQHHFSLGLRLNLSLQKLAQLSGISTLSLSLSLWNFHSLSL